MKKLSIALAVLMILTLVPPASAEDGEMGWVSLETTKSGKSRALIGATIKEDGPMYDELLASGAINSWGIAIPINHSLDDTWNYLLWANFDNWAGIGKIQAGFEKLFASRTPEQMMEGQKAYADATVAGSHHDWIVRHEIHRVNEEPATPPRYFDVGYWTVKPGKDGDFIELYKESVGPIMDKLLAAGTIQGYGVFSHASHGDKGFSHLAWTSIADLAAMDTIDEEFAKGFTEEQMAKFAEIVEWDTHKDQILLIVHLGGTDPEQY
jgi:hypothetical protein